MELNEAYKKVKDEVLNHDYVRKDVNFAILSLHESATKLFEAVTNEQKDLLYSRAAAALVSVFYVMQQLGMENPEDFLMGKLEELKRDN